MLTYFQASENDSSKWKLQGKMYVMLAIALGFPLSPMQLRETRASDMFVVSGHRSLGGGCRNGTETLSSQGCVEGAPSATFSPLL